MISSEIITIITFDDEGKKRIKEARETLEEIEDAFQKAGTGNETNCEYLTAVCHLLNEIERGETF